MGNLAKVTDALNSLIGQRNRLREMNAKLLAALKELESISQGEHWEIRNIIAEAEALNEGK